MFWKWIQGCSGPVPGFADNNNNNIPIQDYVHADDHTLSTYEMTPDIHKGVTTWSKGKMYGTAARYLFKSISGSSPCWEKRRPEIRLFSQATILVRQI